MINSNVNPGKLLIIICAVFLVSVSTNDIQAEDQRSLLDCSQIEDDEERLKCYDEIMRRNSDKPAQLTEEVEKQPRYKTCNDSYLSERWELNEN